MTENERIANAFTEIFDNYFCLYERKDLESLPHDVQLHIADLYYRRPYDESDDGTYEMSEELDREIFKAININDFKKIIKADELQENGVEITEINTRKSIGEDFAFGDPGFSDEDIQESFDECIRSISFRNGNGESATFTSYTELKKALDNPDDTFFHKSVEKTPVRNFSDAGAKKLREMEKNSDVYVDFLKFQGRVFKHSARVGLEFFAQRPETKFIATQSQWEHSGRQVAQGSEAIRFANPDGKTVDLYDFSQVEESKPPQQWAINKKNAPEIKKRLGIPENYPLISGVINTTLTPSDITSCMNALKIPPKDFRTFQKAYINAVQIIASGRLEVGGNKFNIKPDTSVLKMLKNESQKLAFLSHVASSAKNVLMKIENVAMTAKFVAKSERDEQAEKEKVELVNITEAISKKKADIVKMVEEDNFSGATESIKEVENLLKRAEELRKSIRKKPITQDDIQTLRSIQPPRKSVQNLLEKEVAQTTKFESLMSEHMGARSPYEMRKNGDNQPNDAEKRVPVIQLGEHEIPSNLSEIRKKEVLSEIKRGTFENTDTGAKIDFGKKSIDEIISKAMQNKKRGNSVTARICALYDMQEIIKNAVCFDSLISEYNSETSKNKSPNSMFMHNMYAVANHNGNFYLIGLEIEESYVTDRNDNFKGTSSRLYSLRDTEITPVEANRIFSPTVGKNNFNAEDTSTGVTGISISQLYELVKSLDENFHENLQSPGRAERETELLANAEYLDAVQTVQTGRKVTENADRQSEKIKQNRSTKDEQAKENSAKLKKKYSRGGDVIIGNVPFRYIPKKTYTKIEQDILEDVTKKLEESGMKFSGVIKSDGVTLTTSETDKAKLDSIIEEVRSATKNNSVAEQQTKKEKVATYGNSDTTENAPRTSENSEKDEQSELNSAEKVATNGNSDTNENEQPEQTPTDFVDRIKESVLNDNSVRNAALNSDDDMLRLEIKTKLENYSVQTVTKNPENYADDFDNFSGNVDGIADKTAEEIFQTAIKFREEERKKSESESAEKVATYDNSDTTENTPETSDNSETNEQSESGSDEERQYLYSVQHLDDLWYFKVSEEKLNDVLKISGEEKPFQELMELGEPISIEEYAEIQQSDRFGQSMAINFDDYTAEYYTVNNGKGGFSDGDRTDENTKFETVEIPRPELKDRTEKEEVATNGNSDTQYLYSVQHLDDLWYFKVSEEKLNDVLKIAGEEMPFQKLMELGEPISIEEYAEIQQSDRFGQSIAVNFDDYTAEYYTVNNGKGGFSDGDRTDENTKFETVGIPRPELKNRTEKEEVATNGNSDTQYLYSVQHLDDLWYFKVSEDKLNDVLKIAGEEMPFPKLMEFGEPISIEEYAEIQQSDRFGQSIAVNFDDYTAEYYTVNNGKGGFSDGDRTDENTKFETVDIPRPELKNRTEKENPTDVTNELRKIYNDGKTAFYCFTGQESQLNIDTLPLITEKSEQYLIAAGSCLLSNEFMQEHNITFLKYGRDLSYQEDTDNMLQEMRDAALKVNGRFTKLSEEDKQFIDAFPETFISEPIDTPWGKTQQCHEIAKGVFEVSTAGHGGVMIREELAEHMLSPEALEIGFVEGGYHCYEEDADAQVPLRELFDKDIVDIQQYVSERYVKSYEEIGEWLNTVISDEISTFHPDYWTAHESAKDKLNAEMTTSENSEKDEQSESKSAEKVATNGSSDTTENAPEISDNSETNEQSESNFAEKVATNGNSDAPENNFQHENVEIVERPARPTITCEWSESPFFEEGKTYSVAEFDKIMSDADRQKVEGYKKHMEVYGNEDLWLESDEDSYYNFIGYDKTKFNINLPDGRTVTERQDIGDGYGGVVDFLRSFEKNSNYNKIADILEDDIKKYPLESADKNGELSEPKQEKTAPTVSDSEVNDKIIEEELPETEEISDDKNPELREVLNRFSAKHGLGELDVEPSNGYDYTWKLKEKFSDGTDFLLGELRNSEYGMPFTPDELSKSLENFERQIQAKGQNIAEIYSRENFAKSHGGVSKLPKVPDSLPKIRYTA